MDFRAVISHFNKDHLRTNITFKNAAFSLICLMSKISKPSSPDQLECGQYNDCGKKI